MYDLFENINYLHKIFEYWVLKSSNSIAVSYQTERLTYFELNVRANQIAYYLIKSGVQPGDLIGLCVEYGPDLIASILAILKAGASYVPLDPVYPSGRINCIVNDANPKLIIIDGQTKNKITTSNVLNLSELKTKMQQKSYSNPSVNEEKINLCYVIYTSGTTGQPNGVCISHSNVINLLKAAEIVYNFTANDVWTLFHSYAFDFPVWEMWGALAFGGKLIIVSYYLGRTPKDFYHLLIKERVTILNQTPAAFYQLINVIINDHQSNQLNLKYVIFGGDALDFHCLYPWFDKFGDEKPKFYNMYGITETTVHVTYHRITLNDVMFNKSVIGKALPFYKVLLLDSEDQIINTVGQKGEICITGLSVRDI